MHARSDFVEGVAGVNAFYIQYECVWCLSAYFGTYIKEAVEAVEAATSR